MQSQFDVGFFGHGDDALEKILQIGPLLLLCHGLCGGFLFGYWYAVNIVYGTLGGIALRFQCIEIESAYMRAASRGNGSGCAHDAQYGHPRITPYGDFEFAHVPEQFTDDLNFLVSPG